MNVFREWFLLGLTLAFFASLAANQAAGETLAAYTYTHTGEDGVPTLAGQLPGSVDIAYLKAIDIALDGSVLVKTDSSGRFYPNDWTGGRRPVFAALINADPGMDWTTADPQSALVTGLNTHSWTQDYDGGITVDAEFSSDIQSFPQNWQDTMTALRQLANDAGQDFSLYVNPKYLSAARYPATATANATTLATILGTPSGGISNTVLFPVYVGGGANADQGTLDAAAATSLPYKWIFDITEDQTTFAAGLQAADTASTRGGSSSSGYVAYAYNSNSPVTADMTANLNSLASVAAVPEPGGLTMLAVTAFAGLAGSAVRSVSGRRPTHPKPAIGAPRAKRA